MINNTKQNWQVGNTVKVGFLNLIIKAAVATPGDYAPDAYLLTNINGTQIYKFVPHNGIEKITANEATALIQTSAAHAQRLAARAIANAAASATNNAVFA